MKEIIQKGLQVLDSARGYSKSAHILNSLVSQNKNMDLLLPSTVNAALSIELYFKSLHLIVFSSDFKVNGNYSHNFSLIYAKLDKIIKGQMDKDFSELINRRNMKDVINIEATTKVVIPRSFSKNLVVWKDVFIKFRYQYENNFSGSTFFFPEIENVVLKQIYLLKPEWENITYSKWLKCN